MNPDNDPRNLHDLALDVHTDLMKLQSGLMAAGANPEAVQTIQRMAQIVGQVVKVLAAGPAGAQPSQAAAAPQPQQAPAAPAGPPQGSAPAGAMPGERPNALHAATQHLQAAMVAAKR